MNLQRTSILCFSIAASAVLAWSDGVRYVEALHLELGQVRAYVPAGQRLQFLDDGRLVLHGMFTEVNGQPAPALVRLDASGSVDTTFLPDAAFPVSRAWNGPLLVDGGGRIYFDESDGGFSPSVLRRLDADGRVDADYRIEATLDVSPGMTATIVHLVRGVDGAMLAMGTFTRLGGVETGGVALLRADGSVDPGFRFAVPGDPVVREAVPLPDGRWILVGLSSSEAEEYPRHVYTVMRIMAGGDLDPSFTPYVFESPWYDLPHAFAVDSADRVVFAEPALGTGNEGYRLRLGRLETDGARDAGFAPVLPAMRSVLDGAGPATVAWIPPQLRQIVPLADGALLCVAAWSDPSWQGVVRVSGRGVLAFSSLPGEADDLVLWLTRDAGGQWWGEYARAVGSSREPRIVRVRASGGVDPSLNVRTRAPGDIRETRVGADGSIVVTGHFDEIDGVALPGVAVVDEREGLVLVEALQALPWARADLVDLLSDGSLLLQPPPRRAFVLRDGETSTLVDEQGPTFVRIMTGGVSHALRIEDAAWLRGRSAWLDAADRLLVVAPGASFVDAIQSDLVRFATSGAVDSTFRARSADGATLSGVQAASSSGDREGSWVLVRAGREHHVYELNGDGMERMSRRLDVTQGGVYAGWPAGIAGAGDGVLLGGEFRRIDGVTAPGVARLDAEGRIDATWGGWVLETSQISSIRRLGNGLVELAGVVRTPEGEATGAYLRADGLPEYNAPGISGFASGTGAPSASWDGGWIVQRARAHLHGNDFVRRWRATPAVEVPIAAPNRPVDEGETVRLQVEWAGVPVSVSWLRDGQHLEGWEHTFTARGVDDGVVFVARLRFEDDSVLYSAPWVLRIGTAASRIVNGSIRAHGARSDQVLVVAAVVSGSGRGGLLARALGPALGDFGVARPAAALQSTLLRPDGVEVQPPADYRVWREMNGDSHWHVVAAAQESGAYLPRFGFSSGNDQMLFPALTAGAYHLHVLPRDGAAPGVMLGELYSAGGDAWARLRLGVMNLSGRARVGSGDAVLVGGFVIEGDAPLRMLIRAVGPGLAAFGVTGYSTNPRFRLHRADEVLGGNDDWGASDHNRRLVAEAGETVGAFPLAEGSADAAAVFELAPGVYSAVVSPERDGDEGVALFEIYVMP